MRKINLLIYSFFLCLNISSAQELKKIEVDVSVNDNFTSIAGPLDENGNPKRGAIFVANGYIYPKGTFEEYGTDSGILEDGSAEFPTRVIGIWYNRGWYNVDFSFQDSSKYLMSKQVFSFQDSEFGDINIVTDGFESGKLMTPSYRAVTGVSNELKGNKGQAVQVIVGSNLSNGNNLTMEFELGQVNQTTSTSEIEKNFFTSSIYPNPCSEVSSLKVYNEGTGINKASLSIKNLYGQEIFRNNVNLQHGLNSINISTIDFPSGVYFVFLRESNKVFLSEKLIKQ